MKQVVIDIAECEQDSVLAEDIVNKNGMVMLKAGSVLTDDKISALLKNGINSISVLSENKLTPEQMAERRKKVEKNVKKLFRKCDKSKHMSQLEGILIDYYIERGGL